MRWGAAPVGGVERVVGGADVGDLRGVVGAVEDQPPPLAALPPWVRQACVLE